MRCSGRFRYAGMVALFLFAAGANLRAEDRDADSLNDALDKSAAVLANPEAFTDPSLANYQEVVDRALAKDGDAIREAAASAQAIALDAIANQPAAFDSGDAVTGADVATHASRKFRLFLSRAMDRPALTAAVDLARGREDVEIVFRGVNRGEKLMALQGLIFEIVGPASTDLRPPLIAVDPNVFDAAGVTSAPTLALYEDDRIVATVSGVLDTEWLEDAVRHGERGHLGTRGPVVTVTEVNMADQLRDEALAVDWDEQKRRALAGFWAKRPMEDLPYVTEDRVREIDPTFVVTDLVKTPSGEVLAWPGERINPLDRAPFTQVLVVFDPLNEKQLILAKKVLRDNTHRRVTLLATRVDTGAGWEGFNRMQADLNPPIYLLTKEVRERFRIERSPTTVESRGRVFVVNEIDVDATPAEE